MEMESIMLSEIGIRGNRQMPYDLTYKWNLINNNNNKNKQAKYNQNHWNKEQIDGNQRGGGKGITVGRRERVVKEHV